ncbi:hypothetical protein K2Q00_01895 [Patescibacteria group bacterium]|nr:hypothetical protein [Patescibacteria group bacterium]
MIWFADFWDKVLATPFHYVEALFAFLAALAFLLFLRGWLGSVGNIFKMDAHEEHLEHALTRQVHGVLMLFALFYVWEIVRTMASWFGFNDGTQTTLGYWFAGVGILLWVFIFIKKQLFTGGGGGH